MGSCLPIKLKEDGLDCERFSFGDEFEVNFKQGKNLRSRAVIKCANHQPVKMNGEIYPRIYAACFCRHSMCQWTFRVNDWKYEHENSFVRDHDVKEISLAGINLESVSEMASKTFDSPDFARSLTAFFTEILGISLVVRRNTSGRRKAREQESQFDFHFDQNLKVDENLISTVAFISLRGVSTTRCLFSISL